MEVNIFIVIGVIGVMLLCMFVSIMIYRYFSRSNIGRIYLSKIIKGIDISRPLSWKPTIKSNGYDLDSMDNKELLEIKVLLDLELDSTTQNKVNSKVVYNMIGYTVSFIPVMLTIATIRITSNLEVSYKIIELDKGQNKINKLGEIYKVISDSISSIGDNLYNMFIFTIVLIIILYIIENSFEYFYLCKRKRMMILKQLLEETLTEKLEKC